MKNQDTLVMGMLGSNLIISGHLSDLYTDYLICGTMTEDKIKSNIECIRDSAKMIYDFCNIYLNTNEEGKE